MDLSLLDRLLDPGQDRFPAASAGERFRLLRESIRRDMEALLNTRRRCVSVPAALEEAAHSLITYGIPDFSGADMSSAERRDAFRRAVEDAIRENEPRLDEISVTLFENADLQDRILRFRIEAQLKDFAQTLPAVIFDSLLEPVTGSVSVANGAENG